MKIRFYCDVPIYKPSGDMWILANSKIIGQLPSDRKRIAFDVDFPPDVFQEIKESGMGIVSNVTVIAEIAK